jgi:large subunit ribosomal protein L24
MAMTKIKKGDTVIVITGKDKGKEGRVISVEDRKLLVEGINQVKKHTKANQRNAKGGILTQEALIDASNVMYVHKGKPTRIGFTFVDGPDGSKKKVRVAKSTSEILS